MKKFLLCNLALVLLLVCSTRVVGQKGDTISIRRNPYGKITFASFKVDSIANPQTKNHDQFLHSALQMKSGDELRLIKSRTDNK